MEHDTSMRDAARAIYEAVYPTDDWAPVGFEEAEARETVHYRQALDAAIRARRHFASTTAQLLLL